MLNQFIAQLQVRLEVALGPIAPFLSPERLVLPYLVLLASLHGALYVVLIPPWQSPDETAHVWTSIVMARTGQYYRAENDAVIQSIGREISLSLKTFRAFDYLGYPAPDPWPEYYGALPFFQNSQTLLRFSLAYQLYALIIGPMVEADALTLMYWMRALSVVLGTVTVALAYLTVRLITPHRPELASGVACALIFIPQHAHIAASVNDGNLVTLLAGAMFYSVTRAMRGLAVRRWMAAALVFVLAAQWTKGTATFLLPVWTLAAMAIAFRHITSLKARLWAGAAIAMILLVSALFITGYSSYRVIFESAAFGDASMAHFLLLQCERRQQLPFQLWGMFRSFWMDMGWLRVVFTNPNWYAVLLTLTALGALGLPLGGWKLLGEAEPMDRWFLACAALLCLYVPVAVFCTVPISAPLTQGRYWYPGLVPIATLILAGWLGLTRHSSVTMPLLIAALVALDGLALFQTAIPYFYR